jgi:hypothetical protein
MTGLFKVLVYIELSCLLWPAHTYPALSAATESTEQRDSIQILGNNYHVPHCLSSRLHVFHFSVDSFQLWPHTVKGERALTTLHHSYFIALPKSAGLAAFTPVLIYGTLICSWTNIIIMSYSREKKKGGSCSDDTLVKSLPG